MIPWVGKNKVVKLVTMHESHKSDSTNSSVLFLYSRAKNRQDDIGMRFYKTVFPLWQRNDLASPIPVPDQDVAWKKLHQEQQELIGSLSAKSFEEISLGRAGDWVVSLRLGAAGDRMQSVFYSESRHAPFFPPSSSPYDRAKVFFLISKRLLWFQCQWLYSDSTNDHSHYLACLPAPPQHFKHILRHIFSSGFTLESKSLHLSSKRIITFWPMPVRMKMWWTRSV